VAHVTILFSSGLFSGLFFQWQKILADYRQCGMRFKLEEIFLEVVWEVMVNIL
jgi:hypothetical protein